MIEINPQEQLRDFDLRYLYGPGFPKKGFRRFNYLHTKFCYSGVTYEQLQQLREGLTGNEIKPQKQPTKHQLDFAYGFVEYSAKGAGLKFANQWNDIDAQTIKQYFAVALLTDVDNKEWW